MVKDFDSISAGEKLVKNASNLCSVYAETIKGAHLEINTLEVKIKNKESCLTLNEPSLQEIMKRSVVVEKILLDFTNEYLASAVKAHALTEAALADVKDHVQTLKAGRFFARGFAMGLKNKAFEERVNTPLEMRVETDEEFEARMSKPPYVVESDEETNAK